MARKGERFASPTLKSEMVVLVTTEETGGERVVVQFVNQPDDIGPPTHFHAEQQEEFRVVEGTLALRAGDRELILGPGEAHVVAPGTPHTFWNPESAPVTFVSEHRPALGWERFITTLYDLDYDGKANAKGLPRTLQMFAILRSRLGEEYIAGPPPVLQRLAARVLGGLGRLCGYAPTYVSERRVAELSD